MNFLIFSDSHGGTFNMRTVIDRAAGNTDGVIFLGDNHPDVEVLMTYYPKLTFYSVAGNCDYSSKYLTPEYEEKLIYLDGVRVLMLHGHRQDVKSTLALLEKYARSKNADVVLFGHTHERCEKYVLDGTKPLIMFNPGSVSRPRDGEPSFGVLTVNNGQALLSHGDVHVR